MSKFKILVNHFITPWKSTNQFYDDFKTVVKDKSHGDVDVDFFGYAFGVNGGSTKTKHNLDDHLEADLLIDRSGTILSFAGHMLRTAALRGIQVMNYPVTFDESKSVDYQIAHELGIPVPKTVVVAPSKIAKFVVASSNEQNKFKKHKHEVNFEEISDYLGGYPLYFKSAHGGGKQHVYKINSWSEFVNQYLGVGENKQMVAQQNVDFDHYVRCFAFGDKTLKVKYDPDAEDGNRYKKDLHHLSKKESILIDGYIKTLNSNIGYIINTLEFARSKKDKVWYAIDFTNGCNFDMRSCELGDNLYSAALHSLADLALDYVYNPRPIKTMSTNFSMANKRLLDRVKDKPGVKLDKFYDELNKHRASINSL